MTCVGFYEPLKNQDQNDGIADQEGQLVDMSGYSNRQPLGPLANQSQ